MAKQNEPIKNSGENTQGGNSGAGSSTAENILNQIPGQILPSDFHTEGLDQSKTEKRGGQRVDE